MAGQTDLLLEALGNPERRAMLMALLNRGMTEKELRLALNIEQPTASRSLTHLRLVGLIERDHPRGAYRVVFEKETRTLLARVVKLADLITSQRRGEDDHLRTELE